MKLTSQLSVTNTQGYRSDIDGLRGIAVLSVILFHIDKTLIPGGFIGVDIFFVISGYLISLHILKDIEQKQFSLIEFYRRRIKRIVPAMLLVAGLSLILTQILFRPEDAKNSAESAVWSLFSLANVYFSLHSYEGYFAASSNEKPLLHLWSLGVEEQFYIFWPLILLLVYKVKRPKWIFGGSIFFAACSFALGDLMFEAHPSFVYYMLPTRAGELLVGALISQMVLKGQRFDINTLNLLAFSGVILITASFVILSEEQVFPGVRAIPPTIGAGMLILAGQYGNPLPTQFLKCRPVVWVGLISYSAYLWHWPLLAFYRYGRFELDILRECLILSLTFILAWLSYRYIECPARQSVRPAKEIFVFQYLIPTMALYIVGLVAINLDGYGFRWGSDDFKAKLAVVRDSIAPATQYDYVCQKPRISEADLSNVSCVVGAETGRPPEAVLWGDSNAAHYVGMLGIFAQEQGFRFRNIEIGSCPPLNVDPQPFVDAKKLAACRESLKLVRKTIDEFPVVILSALYPAYQSHSDLFLETFFNSVQDLTTRGKLVIILGKAPIISTLDRLCREKAISFPFMNCEAQPVNLTEDVAWINAKLKEFAKNTANVKYYDITEYICHDNKCSAYDRDGTLLYYDRGHLNIMGSWKIGKEIFQKEGVPPPFLLINNWAYASKQ